MDSSNETEKEKIKKVARTTIEYLIKNPNTSRSKITNLKGKFAKKFGYDRVIKNATILKYTTEKERKQIIKKLRRRSTRTLSGVSVIAIMTKPLSCPGSCIYCPGQESQPGEKVAQSYTGREPAAMRSIHNQYDPYYQVKSRISDLEAIGHKIDKIELIIMGGTFLSADIDYQRKFIKGAVEGVIGKRGSSLKKVKQKAEKSERRLVGVTIETRPDYCKEEEVDRMLEYGTTRVEIGVQTVFNEIYKYVKRGHTVQDSKDAIRISKDAGLKVNSHMMPNLPQVNYEQDLETFEILFEDPDYRPDMLKIYPTIVVKGTELYELWKRGEYHPYKLDNLIDLIATVKQTLPKYVRIQRIMRDIPATLIEAGCHKSNLRQLVQNRLRELNKSCSCIRCREYGIVKRRKSIPDRALTDVTLERMDYQASEGQEIFLSYENKEYNFLVGYLRLRKPSELAHRKELNNGKTMIVREVRIVGELVPKDNPPIRESQMQHRGYGTNLMQEAERIAKEEFGCTKLSVISGIGVRDWFYEQGYQRDGPYVSKKL
ncbi:MAG: tRNA uridine(34) 5-carboxymethylaminomethyl modification radical SAM/GNAT enzyme Elp3 [Promethearchaeia archaeon]